MRLLVLFVLALFLPGCRTAERMIREPQREYAVRFEGHVAIREAQLLRWIQLDLDDFERTGFRQAYLDDAAYDIRLGYLSEGYPFAEVLFTSGPGSPPSEVRFQIQEGPRTRIEDVQFEGMHRLTRGNFFAHLASKRASLFQGSEPFYVESAVRGALAAMTQDYVQLGYLDASVSLGETRFNSEGTRASVTVLVNEGHVYRLGKASLTSPDLTPELLREFRERLGEAIDRTDGIWRARFGYELRGMLLEGLARSGYADAKVEFRPVRLKDPNRVDLEYEVQAGPVVRIGQVLLPEELHTRDAFVRSRLELESGETYDSEKVRRSVRRLYETGLFSRVNAELEGSEGEQRDLRLELVESPTGEFFVEPGYGSFERARIQLGFRKKNLWGTGRLLRAEGTYGELAQRASLNLADPWFLGSRFRSDLTLRYDRRELPSFTEENLGAGAFWTREWSSAHSTSFGYQFRRSRIGDIVAQDAAALAFEDRLNISSLQITQFFDTRDNFFLPTRGWYNELAFEFGDEALASELDFLRTTLRLSTFVQPVGQTVVAASLRGGVIQGTDSNATIPLQERFFNGGQNTVRSFRFNELGRRDAAGNPLGGEAFATANLELRHPLTPKVQGALFVDAGNVSAGHSEAFRFSDVQLGVGFGLRYLLPIGPVRVDMGFNPDRDAGDPTYAVHFSIGMAF